MHRRCRPRGRHRNLHERRARWHEACSRQRSMMKRVELRRVCTSGLPLIGALICAGLFAVACSSTKFVSTWRSPTAPLLELRGAKVAAVVLMQDEASRRAAEDTLARDISARGAQGIPMYTFLSNASASGRETVSFPRPVLSTGCDEQTVRAAQRRPRPPPPERRWTLPRSLPAAWLRLDRSASKRC
jgi:hypothetical protein